MERAPKRILTMENKTLQRRKQIRRPKGVLVAEEPLLSLEI